MARPADFDLVKELARPSFTPGQRDAAALADLIVAGEELAVTRAAPALAALRAAGRTAVMATLAASTDEGARARLVGVLGLLARGGDDEARATMIGCLRDPEVRVRRAAAVALGKLGACGRLVDLRDAERRDSERRRRSEPAVLVELRDGDPRRTEADRRGDELDDVRTALITRWDALDVPPDERRALAEALGKLGGEAALARLRALDAGADKELARRRDRAVLMADRAAKRGEDSAIAIDVAPPVPLRVRLRCRAGLSELLRAELAATPFAKGAAQHRDDAVDVELAQPWQALHASRLWASATIRTSLRGLTNTSDERARSDQLAGAIVRALTSPPLLDLLTRWTRGPIRWRLGMAHGHQRSLIWRVAKEVAATAPQLINDPAQTTWDVLVDVGDEILELAPRRIEDPRFAYRVAEVPAGSHPSVAAALAFAAEARAGDRVWDPFCGAGVELVERARRGPVASLLGTDTDETALAAARANLEAAGVTAELAIADARTHAPGPVDLIITNPPLGSRVQLDAVALLVTALPGFARALAPQGRLVWITPSPRQTTPVLERLGLVLARSLPVDLGGVRGRLERWNKR